MSRAAFLALWCGCLAATVPVPARAAELGELLRKGPLVLIEEKQGKFVSATAIALVDAPPTQVWAVLTDFAAYSSFMPRTTRSELVHRQDNLRYVEFEIESPGPDTAYKIRYELHQDRLELRADQVEGDLKGSRWNWRLEPAADGKRTVIYHLASIKNFSSVVESFEDDQQTITMGVTVGSAIAASGGIKGRAELLARKAAAAAPPAAAAPAVPLAAPAPAATTAPAPAAGTSPALPAPAPAAP